ncbi:MAG TPA: hypothetical protein VGK59_08210 [Ohtaekwangia sp.]
MKRYSVFKPIVLILGVVLIGSCDDSDSTINRSGDFYPMRENATWQYISEWGCDYSDCNADYPNWFQYVWEDTVIHGKNYTIVRGVYDVAKIARRQGHKYYEWDVYNNQEYLFLDTSLSPGESWIRNESEYWKTEIFAERPLNAFLVKGKTYHDVIVMREEVTYNDGTYSYVHLTHRYYARGIGEILSVSPGIPNSYFNGSKLSIFRYEH